MPQGLFVVNSKQVSEEILDMIALMKDYVSTQLGNNKVFMPLYTKGGAPTMPTLDDLEKSVRGCKKCKLSRWRKNIVFGEGNPFAEIVFVGEAPGYDEDEQGRPFVGRAGKLLTKIIESISLTREDVYICNVIKCRPPKNRNPEKDEIEACEPFLAKQLEIISPKVICALGKFAVQFLLQTDQAISKLRGNVYQYHGIPVVPTFHPAYLLRNPGQQEVVDKDVNRLKEFL